RITGSEKTAMLTYALFLISTHTSRYDTMIASDSLAVSVLILQAYTLQRSFDEHDRKLLVISGALLTWSYFIRPVASLLFIPAVVLVLTRWRREMALRPLLLFLLPAFILESAWVARNWVANKELNPLTNHGVMPDWISDRTRGHVMDFVRGYGGNYIWWEPGADIRWFGEWMNEPTSDDEGRRAKEPPPDAYAPGYDRDSLLLVSERNRALHSGVLSPADSAATAQWVMRTLDRYGQLHAEHAPFSHHVVSRLRMLRYLLVQSGNEFLFDRTFVELSWWQKIIKILQTTLYAFAMLAGGCYILYSLLFRRSTTTTVLGIWIPVVAVYMVGAYPLILKMAEHRWVSHVYPLWLLMGLVLVHRAISSNRTMGQWAPMQSRVTGANP
ncbi:MAG: hypothetical protein KDB84_12705, partial [Flavobacteriales bacterium]|nr:hypothetical protein [Flavobacteriales bacterium]